MSPERELWACALHFEKEHGERAPEFIAERVNTLVMAGDILGVERWQAIADRFDQLQATKLLRPQ
jgi:hypothetical protein